MLLDTTPAAHTVDCPPSPNGKTACLDSRAVAGDFTAASCARRTAASWASFNLLRASLAAPLASRSFIIAAK
eukprot:COSAG02_NODE_32298_length_518_cov_1.522673_1_plen_71_part_10